MMCCGAESDDWERVRELTLGHEWVVASFGVHPWYTTAAPSGWKERLEQYLLSTPSGVGEIGLDFAVKELDRGLQEHFFREQLRMANRLARPVSLHCRKAFERMSEILREEGLRRGGVVHSYSGAAEMVPAFEALGLYVSFSGTITRPRNKKGHRSLCAVSEGRLLIETDSPDLPPADAVRPVNEPANLVMVAGTVSKILGTTIEAVAETTWSNACRLFDSESTAR